MAEHGAYGLFLVGRMQKFIVLHKKNALARTDRPISLQNAHEKREKRSFPHSPQSEYTKVAHGERDGLHVWNRKS